MNHPSVKCREICSKIVGFYLRKHNGDEVKANKEMSLLKVTNIEEDKGVVTISLARPGCLIGRHGVNIENLQKEIGKIEIKETFCWSDYLIHYDACDDY